MGTLKPLAYDVGMNNGDDSAYYLAKGFRVVGIEANPDLCAACSTRFADAIARGDLTIINCAVGETEGLLNFFIHNENNVLSTLVPQNTQDGLWRSIQIHVRRLSSIIREHGEAHYVKIDVEFMDHVILKDLMDHKIVPSYISSESQILDVFCYLVCMGYQNFKMVDGETVQEKFSHHQIKLVDGGDTTFSFAYHSAGPFGEDIPGPWLPKEKFVRQLLSAGLGWKDIHATTEQVTSAAGIAGPDEKAENTRRPRPKNRLSLLASLFHAFRKRQ